MIRDPRLTAGDPQACLDALVSGTDLTRAESEALFSRVMDGDAPPALIAGLLVALRTKGETEHEIAGAAGAQRAGAQAVGNTGVQLVDTSGTGGEWSGGLHGRIPRGFIAVNCGSTTAVTASCA